MFSTPSRARLPRPASSLTEFLAAAGAALLLVPLTLSFFAALVAEWVWPELPTPSGARRASRLAPVNA